MLSGFFFWFNSKLKWAWLNLTSGYGGALHEKKISFIELKYLL